MVLVLYQMLQIKATVKSLYKWAFSVRQWLDFCRTEILGIVHTSSGHSNISQMDRSRRVSNLCVVYVWQVICALCFTCWYRLIIFDSSLILFTGCRNVPSCSLWIFFLCDFYVSLCEWLFNFVVKTWQIFSDTKRPTYKKWVVTVWNKLGWPKFLSFTGTPPHFGIYFWLLKIIQIMNICLVYFLPSNTTDIF